MKILILGGYGAFGGRLAEMLGDIADLDVLICGRSLERAKAFCEAYQGVARVHPFPMDRKKIGEALQTERPDLVVDASGPFQAYGQNQYDVIEQCIATRVDYMDLADAADFVFGVSKFDAEAKAAGIFILSGVSSFPVLTGAVLRKMSQDMEITSVTSGVGPSPHAGIGLNVMKAILSYAGDPIKLQRDGQQTHAIGLAESMRYTVAVPGKLPMRNTHFSLVDVADLQVLPAEFKSLRDIWIGAGPVPEFLHRMLNLAAKARASFKLPSFAPLAPMFHKILNVIKFGEHRGGMFVEAHGLRNGKQVSQSWHMLAEGDDGPYIPSMAVDVIVRKCLSGQKPSAGAGAAKLDLEDYAHQFGKRQIFTGFRSEIDAKAPLYRKILGSAFDDLEPQVQLIHDSVETRHWAGTAQVQRGSGVLARMVGKLIGFPAAAASVPVGVTMACQKGGELWTRNFAGKIFSSFQELGTGRNQHLLVERFGIISVALALVAEEERMYLIPRRWSCWGIPLPKILLPKGTSFETEFDGDFRFDVEISAPLVGLIVAYKGRLQPQTSLANS